MTPRVGGGSRPTSRSRAVRDGLVVFGLLLAADFFLVYHYPGWHGLSTDGLVYWAVDPSHPYADSRVGVTGAFLYSPAFAQLFWLVGHLPREVFVVGWTVLLAAVALWLAAPWPASLLILLLPVSQDVLVGNIHVLLAAAVVLGFRWPAAWAFVLLTKVTPGIGLIWFAVRKEWRNLLIALAATLGVAAVSFAIAPAAWSDWLALLRGDGQSESSRLIPRLAVAAAICAWGGLTGRRWTVPLAAMLALPIIWSDSFAMLLGCVAVGRQPRASAVPFALPGRRRASQPAA